MRFLICSGLLSLLVLVGCGGGSTPHDACSVAQEESDVLATARQYYLWETELPATVDLASFATPADLLDALTAQPRAEGKDRHFSYMSTTAEQNTFFDQGQNMGYGFGFLSRGTQLFVAQVFPASGAASAGFARGDEVLAVAATSPGLDDAASQAPRLIADGTLSAVLASGTAGTTRHFRLKKPGGATTDVTAASALYSLDPVPAGATAVLDAGSGHKVGYLMLRTFVETASPLLRAAMGQFRTAGVTDVIVDLRYNGGGRVDVAEVLTNLLHAGHAATDVMYQVHWNDLHAANNTSKLFGTEANALAPGRIAFIVTGSSASASELVVNALQPYLTSSLALVGARTYGKPVGQVPYGKASCSWVLMMIAIQLENAQGKGSYFQGLPDGDFLGASVAAEDDLAHAPGDPAETSTAAALAWIASGASPGPIPAAARIAAGARAATRLLHPQPSEAQRNLPGVF